MLQKEKQINWKFEEEQEKVEDVIEGIENSPTNSRTKSNRKIRFQ